MRTPAAGRSALESFPDRCDADCADYTPETVKQHSGVVAARGALPQREVGFEYLRRARLEGRSGRTGSDGGSPVYRSRQSAPGQCLHDATGANCRLFLQPELRSRCLRRRSRVGCGVLADQVPDRHSGLSNGFTGAAGRCQAFHRWLPARRSIPLVGRQDAQLVSAGIPRMVAPAASQAGMVD